MLKRDEVSDPNSCWNKARDDERIFILLARDEGAPEAILYWVTRRIIRGKNKLSDPKIVEALEFAQLMELERRGILETGGKPDAQA